MLILTILTLYVKDGEETSKFIFFSCKYSKGSIEMIYAQVSCRAQSAKWKQRKSIGCDIQTRIVPVEYIAQKTRWVPDPIIFTADELQAIYSAIFIKYLTPAVYIQYIPRNNEHAA